MAELSQKDRDAYQVQYQRDLRRLQDFQDNTRDFLRDVERDIELFPELRVMYEHKIPEVVLKKKKNLNQWL